MDHLRSVTDATTKALFVAIGMVAVFEALLTPVLRPSATRAQWTLLKVKLLDCNCARFCGPIHVAAQPCLIPACCAWSDAGRGDPSKGQGQAIVHRDVEGHLRRLRLSRDSGLKRSSRPASSASSMMPVRKRKTSVPWPMAASASCPCNQRKKDKRGRSSLTDAEFVGADDALEVEYAPATEKMCGTGRSSAPTSAV